jgi:hypothetical protein
MATGGQLVEFATSEVLGTTIEENEVPLLEI